MIASHLRRPFKSSEGPVKRLSHWLRQKACHNVTPNGCTPITEVRPEDIFVVGYPKSGNTWVQELVAGALYGVLPEFAPFGTVQALIPDVHYEPWYKRHATPMFFKSHALPNPAYRRVIYLLRDGRDVMVSFLHYRQALERQTFDFLDFVTNERLTPPCRWHKHVEAWLANPYGAEIMTLRYESLQADPVLELRRLCEFAGLQRPLWLLKLAAQCTDFETMQTKEIQQGMPSSRWPKDKLFRRRGLVGSYKDEMPAEVLEAFLRHSGGVLRQCGYS